METQPVNQRLSIVGALIIASMLFFPDIQLGTRLPAFQFIDFLMPVILFFLFIYRKHLQWNKHFLIISIFGVFIFASMVINSRLNYRSDYFEIYKVLKFSSIILFFTLIDYRNFVETWIKPIFLLLVLVNMFHFFNWFGMNDFLAKFYGGIHIDVFGLNSLDEPSVKRMTGMARNPNINAVLFGFFTIYFLPLKFNPKKLGWFFTAAMMLFLCQSRTAIIALGFLFIVILVLKLADWNWKKWAVILLGIGAVYIISWAAATNLYQYISYSNNVFTGEVIESGSAEGRLQTWKFLFEMIKEKPFFGHAPYKEYFYDNDIYSENEYVLITWRYGFIGLIVYLLMLLLPLKQFITNRANSVAQRYGILFIVFVMVIALANNPLVDRGIMVLFAATLGLLNPFKHRKEELSKDV